MKFPAVAVTLLAALAVVDAFTIPLPRTITTVRHMSSEAIDAQVDYFYDDEEEQDIQQMKVSEMKRELDALKIDYSDCFEKKELEKRLTEARENPGKFQSQQSQSQQSYGYEDVFQNGPVGMKSVETSFESLEQNVQGSTVKKQTFFGQEDMPDYRKEPRKISEPPSAASSNSGGGGQSLQGFLESEEQQEHLQSSHYEEPGPQKKPTFFDATVTSETHSMPESSSKANRWSQFEGVHVEATKTNQIHPEEHKAPQDPNHRWTQFEGVKVEEPIHTKSAHPDADRFSEARHPENHASRWAQFDGVRVEEPGSSGVHFGDAAREGGTLHVEPPRESDARAGKAFSNKGTSMWEGVRVEPTGTTHTDDPFKSSRKQRPSYFNDQGEGTTYSNGINLEEPSAEETANQKYKKANAYEKAKYTEQRDFRYDQQAASTTVFNGVQVEQVPGPDDLHFSTYNREEQGGTERDFRYDPQRAQRHTVFKGIQVECSPGDTTAPPETFRAPAVNNKSRQEQRSRGQANPQTTSFQGIHTESATQQPEEHAFTKKQMDSAGSHTPDDMFNKPTMEQPRPPPSKSSTGFPNSGVGPAQSSYEGLWEKTVGDGELSGNMDIDGRL